MNIAIALSGNAEQCQAMASNSAAFGNWWQLVKHCNRSRKKL
jgi:hypothetical protein